MSDDVTNAPNLPGKDPLTPGKFTTEFMMTGVGMALSALFTMLAAFDVITFTEEQKTAIYQITGGAMVLLPSLYALARSHVKAKAVVNPSPGNLVAEILQALKKD